ncbi:olfactory receptor 10G7-like [Sphaerodactylus townsendi]|uniref:olfactory receptor 10G7-like n=1 Tax=Sphaerodactylus townsendi TaxID=933632 RepID=UPI002025F838|nr:olfactory receptor 10G7-like [Sphaerodactylus townsendi]
MKEPNLTAEIQFTLLGFSGVPELQLLFFMLFLVIYMLTLLGNILILLTVSSSPQLHSPMYYFLSELSLLDMLYSSATVPKMLTDFLTGSKVISYKGCVAQLYAFHFFGGTECFLLTIMAYDRYVAICNPLRYVRVMNKMACAKMAAGTCLVGSLHAALQTALTFRLPYCGPYQLDHYFCDVPPLLKVACAETALNETIVMVNIGLVALSSFTLILGSYIRIVNAVLKMRSEEGKKKAFSTCASHLAVVVLLYGPCILIYMQPTTSHPILKGVSVFYTSVTPALNPVIYALRNEEIKKAMRRLLFNKIFS